MNTRKRRMAAYVAFVSALTVAPHIVRACVVATVTKDVGTKFHVTATDRGEAAVGVQYVLRRADDDCHGGQVLARAKTDRRGRAEFGPVSTGLATLCTVSLSGEELMAWSLNIRAGLAPEENVDTRSYGSNPIPVRSANGVTRAANYEPGPYGQPEFVVRLREAAARKALYETKSDIKGEFSFGDVIPPGRYYLEFRGPKYNFMDGGVYIEVRPNARFARVNLDATFSDCGMSAMQREEVAPAAVAVACGQMFGPMKKPAPQKEVLLLDADLKVVEKVVTDNDGNFQFSSQNAGRYLMYAPEVPYLPARREIDLQPNGAAGKCTLPVLLKLEFGYSD